MRSWTAVIGRLARATANERHEFWPDDVSLLDHTIIDPARVLGPRQLTDIYLLALAVGRGGRFVTFDERVPVGAVHGARAEHVVIP